MKIDFDKIIENDYEKKLYKKKYNDLINYLNILNLKKIQTFVLFILFLAPLSLYLSFVGLKKH